ncbi:hypothetical protein FRB91_007593 [Serendipita sp. 411]|nr:hypothetical protein FRB91_007593 [Serendipita sp. 411]
MGYIVASAATGTTRHGGNELTQTLEDDIGEEGLSGNFGRLLVIYLAGVFPFFYAGFRSPFFIFLLPPSLVAYPFSFSLLSLSPPFRHRCRLPPHLGLITSVCLSIGVFSFLLSVLHLASGNLLHCMLLKNWVIVNLS